jgi:plastocyanin
MCDLPADCAAPVCTGGTCAPTCTDGAKNNDETDIDCGGSCPLDCALGDGCDQGTDCVSGICTGNKCVQVNGCDVTNTTDMTGQSPVTITTSGLTWTPKCIKVSVGTVVTVNATFSTHPLLGGEVIANTKVPASSGPFVPITSSGTTKNFTMTATGTFPYYCDNHALSGMVGAVFVE